MFTLARFRLPTVVVGLVLGGSALLQDSLAAQDVQPGDAEAAYAVVTAFFDGMRAKDADAIAATLTEGATLMSASTGQDGQPRLSTTPMTGFLESIRNATVSLDEPIWDPVIQVSDNLATVWVKYALYVDEEFSHCGVDAFQLFRSAEGWKIFHIADTRRRTDCWEPPA